MTRGKRGKVRCGACGWDGAVFGKHRAYTREPSSWRNGICALCVWQRRRA